VDQGLVAQVVQAALLEDLGASLEPHSLTELDAEAALQPLGEDAAQGAEHGPASVDQLELPVTPEGRGVSGQTGGVPACELEHATKSATAIGSCLTKKQCDGM
jgi:hypothetical protein